MTHWQHRTTCPDCQGQLDPIKVVDATERALGSGVAHVELAYAAANAQESFLTGTIPTAGILKAKLCSQCGRVYFYSTGSSGGL